MSPQKTTKDGLANDIQGVVCKYYRSSAYPQHGVRHGVASKNAW